MPQSDGVHKLKRIEFEFNGQSYKFALNPEEYTQSEPHRVTVTPTKGGAWADDFGLGIPTIQFKGTTGFRSSEQRAYLNNATVTNNNQQRWLENILKDPNSSEAAKIEARDKLEASLTGFIKFKELRDLIRQYGQTPSGQKVTAQMELIFHNYTDEEHWVVTPKTFDLFRSTSRPLLYQYNVQLICLRRADVPNPTGFDEDNLKSSLKKFDLRPFGLRGEN